MEPNKKHDFDAPVEKTTTEIARVLLQRLCDFKDIFIYAETKEKNQKDIDKLNETMSDFLVSYMKMAAETDLPADYISWPVTKVMAVLAIVKSQLEGKLRELQDEYLCRSLEARSPKTGKYASDCITLGEYMLKLEEVRQKTGNDPKDYITDIN